MTGSEKQISLALVFQCIIQANELLRLICRIVLLSSSTFLKSPHNLLSRTGFSYPFDFKAVFASVSVVLVVVWQLQPSLIFSPFFFRNVSSDLFIYFEDILNLCLPLNSLFYFSIDGFSSCVSACNIANLLFSFLWDSLIIMSLLLCFAMIELQATWVMHFWVVCFLFYTDNLKMWTQYTSRCNASWILTRVIPL